MTDFLRRQNTLIVNSNGKPDAWGASYTVTAYDTGAVASATSTDTTIPVYRGHGFAANDKLIVGMDITTYVTVNSVTATQLTVASNTTVADGSVLLNLGPDGGGSAPDYDGSGVTIYSTPDPTTSITNSRVTADAQGGYGYWTVDRRIWELVRDSSGSPVEVIQDVFPVEPIQTATGTVTLPAFAGVTEIDSSGGAVTATQPDGVRNGDIRTIIMVDASNSSTVSVTNHETSDPEVFTFAQVADTLVLLWNGTQWITVANSGAAT